MNEKSGGTGVIIAVVIVILVAVVGWLAYKQGYFKGTQTQPDNTNGLNIQVGGTSDNTSSNSGY